LSPEVVKCWRATYLYKTRSQAVTGIADVGTASQQSRQSSKLAIVAKQRLPAVFEILGSKRIGVTSLTFQGHVTSSVMWSFDFP